MGRPTTPGRPPRPRHRVVSVAIVLAAAAGCSGAAVDEPGDPTTAATTTAAATTPPAAEGVATFGELSRDHVEGPVDYDQDPPVGGAHAPAWQNCGAYDQPIADENAVHSLEHGAVWITYDPELAAEQVNQLWARAAVSTHVLVSPRDGLPGPVVASAWSTQLVLDGATDERLDDFLATYVQGPQTPEPGVTCAGGIGDPL